MLSFTGRAWAGLFDAHDAGYLGRAIDFRHPLLDLRLVRFAIGLPTVPWCVNKHLLRRCLGDLPAAIRRRPKTPLARDPIAELVRRHGAGDVRLPRAGERLARFVDFQGLREALGRTADPWLPLRALCLGIWLEQRDVAPATASADRLAC